MTTRTAIMGLSGGMDSTTLLGHLLEQSFFVHCCLFTYGSKHNSYENAAAQEVVQYYKDNGYKSYKNNIQTHVFDLRTVFQHFQSNLLQTGGKIPEGDYNDENMKLTVVPGRNTIFISVMLGLAQTVNASQIHLGVHSGDHHIYPDCRASYIDAMDHTVQLATEGQVKVMAPFLNLDKAGILKNGYAQDLPVPYHLTRTCYKNQYLACGKCGSCVERLEAFETLNMRDPVKYEHQN